MRGSFLVLFSMFYSCLAMTAENPLLNQLFDCAEGLGLSGRAQIISPDEKKLMVRDFRKGKVYTIDSREDGAFVYSFGESTFGYRMKVSSDDDDRDPMVADPTHKKEISVNEAIQFVSRAAEQKVKKRRFDSLSLTAFLRRPKLRKDKFCSVKPVPYRVQNIHHTIQVNRKNLKSCEKVPNPSIKQAAKIEAENLAALEKKMQPHFIAENLEAMCGGKRVIGLKRFQSKR